MDVHSPMLVNISVYSGHIAEGFREQPPLASALTERWYMAPGVRRIDIREKGVRGTLFIPPGITCITSKNISSLLNFKKHPFFFFDLGTIKDRFL